MILDFTKWKKLNEQAQPGSPETKTTLPSTSTTWTNDPESMKILKIFNTEYLPSLLGDVTELTISEYINKLSGLTRDKFDSAIQFFTQKGYNQSSEGGNAAIKKFQEDLMANSEIKTFTTTEDKTLPFNDGKFGRATAFALVNWQIKKMNKITNKNQKVKDLLGVASTGVEKARAAKVGTTQDVKTGTGTQKI